MDTILFFDNFCSAGDQKDYCLKSHQCGSDYEECPEVPNSTRKSVECFDPSPDKFNCLNRMDKYPDIFHQRLYQEEPFRLNKDLGYNQTGIFCKEGKFIPWTWEGLDDLSYGNSFCVANNTGRSIAGQTLWKLLLRDFGFQGRHYILPDYILEE